MREVLARDALTQYAREMILSLTAPVYHCETCKDIGLVSDPDYPGYSSECQQCARRRKAERLQKMCGLTARERLVNLRDLRVVPNSDTARMVHAARLFIDAPTGFITIYGTCGNAKTVVLQSIVNACLSRDVEAIYTTFYDVLAWIRQSFGDGINEIADQRIRQLREVQVLVIDELDKVKESEWVIEFRNQLIDARYRFGIDGQRGTVFAMNGDIDLLPDWLISRMRDGRNVVVQNNDRDMRPLMRQR